jgi:hypothetical protein
MRVSQRTRKPFTPSTLLIALTERTTDADVFREFSDEQLGGKFARWCGERLFHLLDRLDIRR